jgi:hypothetical protein
MSDHQHEESARAQREALDAAAAPGPEGPVRRSARSALARFLAGEFYRKPDTSRPRPGSGHAPETDTQRDRPE